MKFVSLALPVLLVAAIGLVGCDQAGKPAKTSISPAAMNSPELEDLSSVKLDLYTQAYYLLMNSPDSLRPSYDSFHRVRKARIADDIRFSSSSGLENGLELFKKGLAVHDGTMHDLDEAVRDALLAGNKLQKDEHALEPYFRNQEYREDRLAKAKAFYPSIQADYEAVFAHMEKIETLLFKYRRVQSEKRMAAFREKNNWLGYYTEESLRNAQDLLAVFSESDEAIKNAGLYSRGNDVLARLEASLASQRKAFEEARANGARHISEYPAVNRILTSFIGSYRDLRQHKAVGDLTAMYKKYNDAIVAHKRASRFSE